MSPWAFCILCVACCAVFRLPPLLRVWSDICSLLLQYKGCFFAHKASTMNQLLPLIRKVAEFGDDEPLLISEEIKSEPTVMCEALKMPETIQSNQLEDGDILVVQRAITQVCYAFLVLAVLGCCEVEFSAIVKVM